MASPDAEVHALMRADFGPTRPAPGDFGRPGEAHARDAYAHLAERDFVKVSDDPLSTFSIDVDTASYANMRRFVQSGQRPPVDAVRVEEFINYFTYDYPQPKGDAPFSVTTEVGVCPWNSENLLVHVGIQGKKLDQARIPARNLVFLLDVSGSMRSSDRLPLLVEGLNMLTDQLTARDRVSIVVYAGASGLVLPPTPGSDKATISAALRQLTAGGSTNGAAGIRLAYRVAQQSMIQGGINRVILATDGDFNVGTSSEGELVRMIEKHRETGVHLSVLGFGRGNLNDSTMEKLADKGNGNYAYIDGRDEARKVLVQEAGSTLVTIAKDVKLQVEFNPAHVESQRLVGYENRTLAHQDFRDDKKDAGEIGAGHSVTALYEIVLRKQESTTQAAGAPLRYQGGRAPSAAAASDELLNVALRYKAPNGHRSREFSVAVSRRPSSTMSPSADFRFSAAVAEFAQLLRGSKYVPEASFAEVQRMAASALGEDRFGHRQKFIELVRQAERLVPKASLARRR